MNYGYFWFSWNVISNGIWWNVQMELIVLFGFLRQMESGNSSIWFLVIVELVQETLMHVLIEVVL